MRRASPSFFILSPVAQAVLRLVLFATLGLAAAGPGHAQAPADADADSAAPSTPLALKSSPLLSEGGSAAPPEGSPTFVFGDRVSGRPDLETVIDGHAELRRDAKSMRADHIEYYQPDDQLKSRGNVRINNAGNRFEGPELELKVDRFEGFFTTPRYRFLGGGNGQAERVDFIDDKHLSAQRATYTTCERGNEASWKPAWELSARRFDFDLDEDVGLAIGAIVRFKEVPIFAFPVVSFPLSDKRKSGLLPPTLGLGSLNGFEYRQPYYFDIAPNRDATFSPGLMTKRGVDLAGEYRYLDPAYKGQINANVLPGDTLRNRDRWSYSLQHLGAIDTGVSAIGALGLNLNLNRVSDNDYWRDFPIIAPGQVTQRLLTQDASLTWNRGYFTSAVRAVKYQTLQDVDSPIIPPYDRLPQLTAAYTRVDAPLLGLGDGFDWSAETDFTRFSADQKLTNQPNGNRAFARLQVSRPWLASWGYVTPKMQLHATSYQFESPLANGATSASRMVPTFSLDSGLEFERDASLFGRSFTQTLEPRAFYVRTPFRDQSYLPNYDSGVNSFNFATVFTENSFVGNDRISDANLLTLGLTSRLLDPATGAEAVRLGIAQRLRFDDQQVTLPALGSTPVPGVLPVTDRVSDLLVGASVNWVPQWAFDSTVQYNPKIKQSEMASIGVRYNPSSYRTLSAAFRRQRNISQQVDVGWQWPINDLWGDQGRDLGPGRGQGGGRYYSVGRLNYSTLEKKLVDAVVGIEYDGCCWIGRVVLQRSQNSTVTSNTRILFQLEMVGFSRIGSSPLETLKTNVPRYQYLRDNVSPPSRFTTYD